MDTGSYQGMNDEQFDRMMDTITQAANNKGVLARLDERTLIIKEALEESRAWQVKHEEEDRQAIALINKGWGIIITVQFVVIIGLAAWLR